MKESDLGLTFDDILLLPRYSNVLPADVDTSVRLTKGLTLNIPIISSAMDTVTESKMAIALAREGGLGIIHKNMDPKSQAEEIKKVKKASGWVIEDPICLSPDDKLAVAKDIKDRTGINSFPVVKEGKLVGIVTNRDLRFKTNFSKKISEVMTKKVITVPQHISIKEALRIFDENRIEKLPVVDGAGCIKGLITVKDIERARLYPNALKDDNGRLRVGAAVGPFDMERVRALIDAGVDLIVIDTAHGHSENVIKAVKRIKGKFKVEIMAGNVATPDGVKALAQAGADIVKVGVGPGAICTTRVVTGVGVPQVSAVLECSKAARKYKVPIISDGGIKFSGDIAKALAVGAHAVMIGSLFAGTEETPGRVIFTQGRKYKRYRGMGSIGAMEQGSSDRYGQMGVRKLVPEGIEGIVPYRGSVSEAVYQLMGGVRSSMGYCGCKSINQYRGKIGFKRITQSSLKESHPHDVTITEEAPNYQAGTDYSEF